MICNSPVLRILLIPLSHVTFSVDDIRLMVYTWLTLLPRGICLLHYYIVCDWEEQSSETYSVFKKKSCTLLIAHG